MSTHNIGFYEDLTKIIFELSSNIIKNAPYFFCWKTQFQGVQCRVVLVVNAFIFFLKNCFVVAIYDLVHHMEAMFHLP